MSYKFNEPSKSYLREVFAYRDGKLHNIKSRKGIALGQRCGTTRADGYRTILVDGVRYYEHRIVYIYHYGKADMIIDHIDRNPSNNRIENLRQVSHSQNSMNSERSSRAVGVYWRKDRGKWAAWIKRDGKKIILGSGLDFFEMVCLRKSAELYG